MPPPKFDEVNRRLNQLLAQQGRSSTLVRRSLMTGIVFGRDEAEVQRFAAARKQPVEKLRERGIIVGTVPEALEQLKELEEVGCQRVMLQWLELDDLDRLEALAHSVLRYFQA